MIVDINKDFLTEYKDDFWKGFSAPEVACIALGSAVGIAVTALVVYYTGMRPSDAVYIGIPAAAPIIFLGFYKYQGYLSPVGLLKEIAFTQRTRHMHFESAETDYACIRTFSMERPSDKGRKRPRERKEKKGKRKKNKGRILD